jgi:hypothetical protein
MRIKLTKTIVIVDEDLPKWMDQALEEFGSSGKVIAGIKLLRGYLNRNDDTGFGHESTCGLKEAKDFFEANYGRLR